jgi:hypothetical protein
VERFDDVEFRIVEDPEPPKRPRRRRRWVLALTACALTTGALAAGASALGGEETRVAAPAKSAETSTKGWWKVYGPDGRGCGRRDFGERSRVRH